MSLTPGIVGNLILQNQVGLAKSCLEFSLFGINIQRILDACLLLFLLLFLRGEASEEHGHLVHGHPLTCDEITKLVLVSMCWHLLLWSYPAFCWQVMILWPLVLTSSTFGSDTLSQHFCSPLDGFETLGILPPVTLECTGSHCMRPLWAHPERFFPPSLLNYQWWYTCWKQLLWKACRFSRGHWKGKHRSAVLWDLPKSFGVSMKPPSFPSFSH